MKRMFIRHILCLTLVLVPFSPTVADSTTSAAVLHDFKSDGCSLFPDGDLEHRDLWCDCCFAHDITYWRGGTQQERKQADEAQQQSKEKLDKYFKKYPAGYCGDRSEKNISDQREKQ
jgi:hypothetical protein